MKNNEWIRNNRTLLAIVDDLCRRRISRDGEKISIKRETNIMNKYNEILDRLMEYSIENVTIQDIKNFIKRKLGQDRDIDISDEDIISFIMDENNREDLIRFGQLRNPIDTRIIDSWQRKNNIERDDRWE